MKNSLFLFLLALILFSNTLRAQTMRNKDDVVQIERRLSENRGSFFNEQQSNPEDQILTTDDPRLIVRSTLDSLRAIGTPDTFFVYRYKSGSLIWDFVVDANDNTSPDDSVLTLVTTNSVRLKRVFYRIVYPEDFGAVGDNTTDDGPAFNRMFRWMEETPRGSYEVRFRHNDYYVAESIVLPKVLQSNANALYVYLKISGYGVSIRTDQIIDIFHRMPTTDQEVGIMNSNYKLVMEGLHIAGSRYENSGQIGLKIGCMYGGLFKNLHFVGLDTAVVGQFLTKCTFEDCFFTVSRSTDIVLRSLYGKVGDQTIAGSATNDPIIHNCRFFKETGSYAAIVLEAVDNAVIDHYIIEGAQPRYGIWSDYLGSTVVNTLLINDGWFEGFDDHPSVNFRIVGAGLTRIRNTQRTYPDTLFDFRGSGAAAQFEFDGFTYSGNMADVPFAVDGFGFSGRSLVFRNVDNGMVGLLKDPAKWTDGLPGLLNIQYMDNYGYTIESFSDIRLFARTRVPNPVNRTLWFDSNVQFWADNESSIGGYYTYGYARPRAIHVGITGVYVDNAGRYYFGTAGITTPDVSIARGSSGRIDVLDNSFAYRDMKMRTITLTEQINAINLAASSIRTDSAATINRSTGDLEMRPLYSVVAKSSNYSAATNDYTITGNASSGTFTVTLPSAVGLVGKILVLKKIDNSGNTVTVATASSQTIDGASTYSLAAQWKYVTVQSDDSNWIIIGNN